MQGRGLSVIIVLSVLTLFVSVFITNQYTDKKERATNNLRIEVTPAKTAITYPSLPDIFQWTSVPKKEILSNKNVLYWIIDLRECTGKSSSSCKYPERYYSDNSSLEGAEWVSHRTVNSPEESGNYDYGSISVLMHNLAEDMQWLDQEYKVKPGYSIFPARGRQSATYQPTCIYDIKNGYIKVSCLTRIVSDNYVKGYGMETEYVYPYTEEFRFFVSESILISSLIEQLNTNDINR